MFKVLTFLILTTIVFGFQIIEHPSKPYLLVMSRNDQLGFYNLYGPGMTSKQINLFTDLAENASYLFGENPYQHAQYIKEGMDNQFGSTSQSYFVMIQTEKTNSSYLVWITDKKIYASITGINPTQTNWSYLFVKINAPKTSSNYVFIEHGQIGIGITPTIDAYINKLIDKYEPPIARGCPCRYEAIESIGGDLNSGLNQAWSSICGSIGVTHSLVYAVGGLWISKERYGCEYTFYVHQY